MANLKDDIFRRENGLKYTNIKQLSNPNQALNN